MSQEQFDSSDQSVDSIVEKALATQVDRFESLQEIFDSGDEILNFPEKPKKTTQVDRLTKSFLEIIEFVTVHGREPSATTLEISERKLGARLEGIRANPEKIELLRGSDELGLLNQPEAPSSLDELLELAGTDDFADLIDDPSGLLDMSSLPEDRSRIEPDEVASREKCQDFDTFSPLFQQKHKELKEGLAKLVPFKSERDIEVGSFFVKGGMLLFVADIGEKEPTPGVRMRWKERTRTIFENGTESGMYRRSLASQLYEDDGFRVVPSAYEEVLAEDESTGWVYVLRSLSDNPQISSRRNLYKIGFSTVPVEKRIANAVKEPTYLMAPVEIIETYRTYNMKTSVLEHLLHRVFAEVRLDLNQVGVDGRTYNVTEWFEVPLPVIRQAAELITSGEIRGVAYDSVSEKLIEVPEGE